MQSVKTGELSLVQAPRTDVGPSEVLVRTTRSTVSPGTERAIQSLASANLLDKARARPDLVRKVLRRASAEGIRSAAAAVRTRLDDEMPLGYSAVGVVEQLGEQANGLRVGQRVATGGQGHADFQVASSMLAVPVPDSVSDRNAAMTTIGAIALQGLRQGSSSTGSRVVVLGLGLVGQISARLALASGCEVAGIDVDPSAVERAASFGVRAMLEGPDVTRLLADWSGGHGVDCVQVTAGTKSSAPVLRATELCRDRGEIVVVGDVGLELDRRPFYEKELSLKFARSYGPGRYERTYEDWGVDYPIGYVRWTEQRNMEAVLGLMARGAVDLEDLVTHEFELTDAIDAYALVNDRESGVVSLQFTYDSSVAQTTEPLTNTAASGAGPDARASESPPVESRSTEAHDQRSTGLSIGLIGAGSFVRSTLFDAIEASGIGSVNAVAAGTGTSAQFLAARKNIDRVADNAAEVITDPDLDLIVIASSHSTHAALVVDALDAGKSVFVEKPLALSDDELDTVVAAFKRNPGGLAVGFNRRHSALVGAVGERLADVAGPRVMTYRINAGEVDPDHWYFDRREGGRLIGEICHFVDTCNAIAGGRPVEVHAFNAGTSELILDGNVVVSILYADGSLASISYSSAGHGSMEKERFEILSGGHSAVISNYQKASFDGKQLRVPAGKGHAQQLEIFRRALMTGQVDATFNSAIITTEVTLAAIESISRGSAVALSTSRVTA